VKAPGGDEPRQLAVRKRKKTKQELLKRF
jgi:hypothetical protein